MTRKEFIVFSMVFFASIFGITGLIKELTSHADAFSSVEAEAEDGVITGPAVKVTDNTASGGAAVQFGNSSNSTLRRIGWGIIVATNSGTYSGSQASLYKLAWQVYGSEGTGTGPKFYDGGDGIAKTWSNCASSTYGSKPNETGVQLCWKGTFNETDYLASCRSAVAAFPTRTVRTTYWQEGDRPSGTTPADMQAQIQNQYNTIQSAPDLIGKVEVWPCFTAYNQVESPVSGRSMEDFVGDYAAMCGGLSIDIYQFQGSNVSQTWTAADDMDAILQRANAMGLPVRMAEMGTTDLGGTDTDAKRAARTQTFYDWGSANAYDSSTGLGCLGGDYYENYSGVNNTTTTGPTGFIADELSSSPLYPLSFAVVKNSLTS